MEQNYRTKILLLIGVYGLTVISQKTSFMRVKVSKESKLYVHEEKTYTFEEEKVDEKVSEGNNVLWTKFNGSCAGGKWRWNMENSPGTKKGIPVQYIHIPKTGGTTIQLYLKRWFPEMFYMQNKVADWDCPSSLNAKVLVGHRGFGFCERFTERDMLYIVTVRDPLERFVSQYDYVMRTDYKQFMSVRKLWGDDTLDDLLHLYNQTKQDLSNVTRRENSTAINLVQVFDSMFMEHTTYLCGFDCLDSKLSLQEKKNRAKQNLERIHVVATTKNLYKLLPQLRFHMNGIKGSARIKNRWLQSTKRTQISRRSQDIIIQNSKSDYELYNRAIALEAKYTRVASSCLSLAMKLAPFLTNDS
mmetsp:Transcript_2982/g.4029  ORF Transcript_2982/g.4029 Transcript_2982/m.4029 type:complete len:358 (-) Transcript_2982:25-1098(-)